MGIISEVFRSGSNPSSRPVLQTDRCLNRKQNKYTCTVCEQICPENVFSLDMKEEVKWYRCVDCALCVSACPSRCFVPSPDMRRILTEDTGAEDAVIVACDREKETLKRKVTCLAGIPWELLAFLTFYKDVVLYTKSCASCEKDVWRSCLQDQLKELRDFLGEKRFRERVHLIEEGTWESETPEDQKRVTRREILSRTGKYMKKNIYRAAASHIPQLENTQEDALQYRRLLSQAVTQERGRIVTEQKDATDTGGTESLPVYSLSLPSYTTSCFGCTICERVCPQKAIEIRAEEGGTRLIYITPWKCTACGLCSQICPHGGLSGLKKTQVPYLEQLPLVRVKSESCEKCGTAIPVGTVPAICPVCASKTKRLRR